MPSIDADRPPVQRTGEAFATRLVPIFLVFTSGYFLSYFLRSANAVLAPDLQRDVGLGPADLGFMTATFFGAYAAAQVPFGLALDRWGPRGVATALMSVGALGAVTFAVGESLAVLTIGRILLGLGTGSVLLAGLKAFALWFPPARLATVSGLYFSAGSLGALLASAPLAWANALVGWRTSFLVAAGLVAAVTALIWVAAPSVAAGGAEATDRRSDPAATVHDEPQVPGTGWALATVMFLGAAFTGPVLAFQTLWGGPYLFDGYGADAVTTGRTLLVLSLGVTAGYATSGAMADRFGLQRVTWWFGWAFVATQAALAWATPATVSLTVVTPLYALLGFTGGYCVLVLANGRSLVPLHRSGRATGLVNASSIGGVFVIQWAIGIVVQTAGGHHGYQFALAGTAAMTALALVLQRTARARVDARRATVG